MDYVNGGNLQCHADNAIDLSLSRAHLCQNVDQQQHQSSSGGKKRRVTVRRPMWTQQLAVILRSKGVSTVGAARALEVPGESTVRGWVKTPSTRERAAAEAIDPSLIPARVVSNIVNLGFRVEDCLLLDRKLVTLPSPSDDAKSYVVATKTAGIKRRTENDEEEHQRGKRRCHRKSSLMTMTPPPSDTESISSISIMAAAVGNPDLVPQSQRHQLMPITPPSSDTKSISSTSTGTSTKAAVAADVRKSLRFVVKRKAKLVELAEKNMEGETTLAVPDFDELSYDDRKMMVMSYLGLKPIIIRI